MVVPAALTDVIALSFPGLDVLGALSSVEGTDGSEDEGYPVSDWYVPAREVWPKCVVSAPSPPPLSVIVRGGVEFGVLSGSVPVDGSEMSEGKSVSE